MKQFLGELAERFAVEVTVKGLDFLVFVARAAVHLLIALVEARNAGLAKHVGLVAEGGGWPPPEMQPPGQDITSTK